MTRRISVEVDTQTLCRILGVHRHTVLFWRRTKQLPFATRKMDRSKHSTRVAIVFDLSKVYKWTESYPSYRRKIEAALRASSYAQK